MSLPEPLVTTGADLTGFPGFLLDVEKLLSSELLALATPAEFRAAVLLWCHAWKQTPPASLPNDDRLLAAWSGAGADWPAARDMALRGFVLCSDQRLYHKTLAADANRGWAKRVRFRERAAKGNRKRWSGRQSSKDPSRILGGSPVTGTGTVSEKECRNIPPQTQIAAEGGSSSARVRARPRRIDRAAARELFLRQHRAGNRDRFATEAEYDAYVTAFVLPIAPGGGRGAG